MPRRKNQLLKQIDPKSSWVEKMNYVGVGDFKDSLGFAYVDQTLIDLHDMNTDLSSKDFDDLEMIPSWAEEVGKRVIRAIFEGDVKFLQELSVSLEHILSHQTGEGEDWGFLPIAPIRTEILKYVAIKKQFRGKPVWEEIEGCADSSAEWGTGAEKKAMLFRKYIDTERGMEDTFTIREIMTHLKNYFPSVVRKTVVRICKELEIKIDSRPGRPKKIGQLFLKLGNFFSENLVYHVASYE